MNVYIYNADIYCEGCGNAIRRDLRDSYNLIAGPSTLLGWLNVEDSNEFPQGPYPDGGGEADSPQHCGSCHAFLENPLTPDGVAYVKEKLAKHECYVEGTSETLVLWRAFYADQLT